MIYQSSTIYQSSSTNHFLSTNHFHLQIIFHLPIIYQSSTIYKSSSIYQSSTNHLPIKYQSSTNHQPSTNHLPSTNLLQSTNHLLSTNHLPFKKLPGLTFSAATHDLNPYHIGFALFLLVATNFCAMFFVATEQGSAKTCATRTLHTVYLSATSCIIMKISNYRQRTRNSVSPRHWIFVRTVYANK